MKPRTIEIHSATERDHETLSELNLDPEQIRLHSAQLEEGLRKDHYNRLFDNNTSVTVALAWFAKSEDWGSSLEVRYFSSQTDALSYLAGFVDGIHHLIHRFDAVGDVYMEPMKPTQLPIDIDSDETGGRGMKPLHEVLGEWYLISTIPGTSSAYLVRCAYGDDPTLIRLPFDEQCVFSLYTNGFKERHTLKQKEKESLTNEYVRVKQEHQNSFFMIGAAVLGVLLLVMVTR